MEYHQNCHHLSKNTISPNHHIPRIVDWGDPQVMGDPQVKNMVQLDEDSTPMTTLELLVYTYLKPQTSK